MRHSPFEFRHSHILSILFVFTTVAQSQLPTKPAPHLIKLNMKSTAYQHVLGGSGESSTMRSGLVTLAPGKSVGKHNTEKYEEMVVVLQGTGTMKITGADSLKLQAWSAAYCPSHTEHDVWNTGTDTLRYIYIVAESKK